MRVRYRVAALKKKRELGLHGSLKGRHLSKEIRDDLLASIGQAREDGATVNEICHSLEITPRAFYRWKSGKLKNTGHGGGGGLNKIKPSEEKKVVNLAKKNPAWKCRRIAYILEKDAKAFIGKTKVAEILKKHGLNHSFVRGQKKPYIQPAEMLLHEPYRPNLLWGMDWTWVNVGDSYMFLLVVLDWYSRKILAWGLFKKITSMEVVAVLTDAVAIEKIDLLPTGCLKPLVVADHGSPNIAKYTRDNIEVQGLTLWLSGIGRPTGNARTERVIGTLKAEEIKLQDFYVHETEARSRIKTKIWDYNMQRPNSGNGGFAPNSVHLMGRHMLTERRKRARKDAMTMRRNYWMQENQANGGSNLN